MEKKLDETKRVIAVSANRVSGNYRYIVNYETDATGKNLNSLNIALFPTKEMSQVSSYNVDSAGNTSISFTNNLIPQAEVIGIYQEIVNEVNDGLTSETA